MESDAVYECGVTVGHKRDDTVDWDERTRQ